MKHSIFYLFKTVMNSFSLIAEVFTNPELRTTPDNQIPVSNFLVQFSSPGAKPEDPPHRLKVSAWRNLATEVQENYHKGDQILIEGRIQINTIDRGTYKEKVAELVAQKIIPIGKPQPKTTNYDYGAMPSPPPMEDPTPDDLPF